MLYIIDYNPENNTLSILDTDDNIIEVTTKEQFIIEYYLIKDLIVNKFYSRYIGARYNKILSPRMSELGCFEIYDKNDLNKTPEITVLLKLLGINNFTELLDTANKNAILASSHTIPSSRIESMSFCMEMLSNNSFDKWLRKFKRLYNLLFTPYIHKDDIRDDIEFCIMFFYYMRDYLIANETNAVALEDILLGGNHVKKITSYSNGYEVTFDSDLWAKFYFLAYHSLKVSYHKILRYMSSALFKARDTIGEYIILECNDNTCTVLVEHPKDMCWVTKNYVFRR